MLEIQVEEFVRRLKPMLEQEGSLAFFLGAGTSISSGIPGAKTLVGHWLPKLCKFQTGDENPSAEWLAQTLPNYNSKNPAGSYA